MSIFWGVTLFLQLLLKRSVEIVLIFATTITRKAEQETRMAQP